MKRCSLSICLSILLTAFPSVLCARSAIFILMERYDPNTELALEGQVLRDLTVKGASSDRPVVIPVSMKGRVIFVILGPHWFVRNMGIYLRKGELVRVVGSKVYGRDGRLYIIARELFISGGKSYRIYIFRNKRYVPFWYRTKETGYPMRR